jgi:hypothetical protein
MDCSDLTDTECKVWQAAATGTLVDLRTDDPKLDSPEKGAQWGPERTVRAEVIAALLLGGGEAASVAVRRVRLQGARITGELDLEAATLRCPLALLDCSFASAINLDEAIAPSVRLSGSHTPTVRARQLQTRGDLRLDEDFSVSLGWVDLAGSHIGGDFNCTGGQFFNSDGPTLFADRLTVDGDMLCDKGFIAEGQVSLLGAHIGGLFSCTGGHFSNSDGPALFANSLTVERRMLCDQGFSAIGGVNLDGAHIEGLFSCTDGHFFNPRGDALGASRLTVEGDMLCTEGFSAEGAVNLAGAHIGRVLNCRDSRFSNPNGVALDLFGATVSVTLFLESVELEGTLNLADAKTRNYYDNPAFWPEQLWLDGFVYDNIEGASAKERREWLLLNKRGYSPQIYDQLAAVYRSSGWEEDARRILIEKQRRRSAAGNFATKLWGFLLDWTVGYGYHTWLALVWLAGPLVLGTILFGDVFRGDLTPANKGTPPTSFQPFLYTLDLLLPVVSLHVRDAWIAHGAAQGWSVVFIIMGWILATAVALSLTGLLKRD